MPAIDSSGDLCLPMWPLIGRFPHGGSGNTIELEIMVKGFSNFSGIDKKVTEITWPNNNSDTFKDIEAEMVLDLIIFLLPVQNVLQTFTLHLR